MRRYIDPFTTLLLVIAALCSFATPAQAAGAQAVLLAEHLMDREVMRAFFMSRRRDDIRKLVVSWNSPRQNEAEQALLAKLSPLLADIFDTTLAKARVKASDLIDTRLSASDVATLHRFFSSSAGAKFITFARAGAAAEGKGSGTLAPIALTAEEKALEKATFSSSAWTAFKALGPETRESFQSIQAAEFRARAAQFEASIAAVRERFAS